VPEGGRKMNRDKNTCKEREKQLEDVIWERYNTILDYNHEVRMTALEVRQKRLAVKKAAKFLSLDEGYVLSVVQGRDSLVKIKRRTFGSIA
jgi:hypothetical protein